MLGQRFGRVGLEVVAGLKHVIPDGMLVVRERSRVNAAELAEEMGSRECVRWQCASGLA